MEDVMDKSVQSFLITAQPNTYFETTFGRFIFVRRVGGLGYEIVWMVLGGKWASIESFKVMGKFQNGTQRRVRPDDKFTQIELGDKKRK